MGQKINPNGFRVGVIRDWTAKWYADKDFANYLNEDLRIRKYFEKRLADASVSTVEIERAANRVTFQFTLPSQEWLLVRVVQKLKHFVRN